jgi:hypothetical protein
MSFFSKIKDAIFGQAAASDQTGATSSASSPSASGTTSGAGASTSGTTPTGTVDVAAVLDRAVAAKGQKLEWRTSIVDLMKALDLDSSLSARKELASDLNYTGDTKDSATMNIWLHKQVMRKLAENGGKVPDSLKG